LRKALVSLLKQITAQPTGALGLAIVSIFLGSAVLVAIFPGIVGYNPFNINVNQALLPPSLSNLLGTDNLGRSVLKQVLTAAPLDAFVSLAVVGIALSGGGILGMLAGYLGGAVDDVLMRTTDMFLSFPALILAVGISAALGPGATHAMLAIVIVDWPAYARFARGDALAIRELAFVKSARLSGHNVAHILRKHILPNVAPSLICYGSVDIGYVMITFSVLGYLGLGAQPPTSELGMLVFQGQTFLSNAPWFSLLPGVIIVIVAIGFCHVGDSLRDALDPTRKKSQS
jgi:peptide/nickel transport system permease protein